MQIDIQFGAEGVTVTPTGRFDAHECADFRSRVTPLLVEGVHMAVDLSAVTFLDSSALAELVRVRKRARAVNGDTVLVRPSDPVRIILELTGLADALTAPQGAG